MTHPADSIAWKEFDNTHPSFAKDPRSIRLELSTDGFNPYGNMNNAYSIWPVILVPYNLPPWKCLKDPFFLLSMIIPGPKCIGNDMDIFFRPLIDELKEFFDTGFETYDAAVGEKFMLRAALLWTISDFPAYAYLSWWSTKGYKACPVCLDDTTSVYLRNGLKCCYMGHRRFLPADHKWRRERKSFDGKSDLRQPIRTLSGEEILEQLQEFYQMVFDELDAQEKNIVVILCKLEKIFPPNFVDVMVHLPAEAKLAGPAQYWWMFPFERKMGQYKGYVHNRAQPEGCIVERYLDDECLTFISRYLHNVPTIFNEPERNTERFEAAGKLSIFSGMARPFGAATFCCLSESELMKIHLFILKNCEEIDDYIRMYKELLQQQNVSNVEQMHDLEFPKWFEDRVTYMHTQGRCCDELLTLAKGLDFRAIKYPGCNVNGFRFHTKTHEVDRKTQNSGIMVKGEHADVEINFYGAITDILEVEYSFSQSQVVLFKCDW
ncbi:uncharacterized protein [Coffea arabica]|uniref:DUF4218 domain-containing protein n=1 Tax=Coffea arabica TaxID=13443 RepID=A0ABM4VZ32_COFAR